MAAKACYAPDGTNRNAQFNATDGWLYSPCDNSASQSMCCAVGPGRDGSQDTCLSGADTGLCGNPILNDAAGVWRESCTDPTWQDPACLKIFVNGTGINSTMGTILDDDGLAVTDVNMRKCDDGSFCYGVENLACCAQGQGVFLLNGEQVAFNPNAPDTTSSNSATSTPTSTPTTSSTSSMPSTSSMSSTSSTPPTPTDSSTSGLSTGAKAGVGVGAALGALLIIALICWFTWRRTRKSRRNHTSKPEIQNPSPMEQTPHQPAHQPAHQPLHELPSPPTASRSGLLEMEGSSQWSGSGEDPLKKGTPVGRFA